MSNLIKEAIADARTMREMAVAQAKAALEEAFEPQIHSVITKKIQSEMDGDEEEVEIEDEEEVEVEEAIKVGEDEAEHENAQENSGLTEVEDTSDIGQGDNKEPSKSSSEETTEDPGGEVDLQDGHEDAKENSGLTEELDDEEDDEELDEDFDLDSVISELENEAEEDYEEEEMEAGEPEVEDELGEADDDDEEELDIEIEPETEDEIDMEVEPEVESDVEPDVEIDDEVGSEEEEEGEDELDLEGLVDEAENDYVGRITALETQVASLTGKLGEAIKVVKYQKDRLFEVNILNAKLLFTNKVFRGFNLDNKAKVKVIENFDRANTVREVKLIFATLMENLAVGEKRESKKVQRLVEGASQVINTTNSKKKVAIVDENNEIKSRVHKLMGKPDLK